MRRTQTVPSPEELELLSQVVRDVARGRRLSREDAQDFAQSVHLRCLERNYDIFMKFQGRSSLKTYLTIVVRRILLDWRNSQYREVAAVRRRSGIGGPRDSPRAIGRPRWSHHERGGRDPLGPRRRAAEVGPESDGVATAGAYQATHGVGGGVAEDRQRFRGPR